MTFADVFSVLSYAIQYLNLALSRLTIFNWRDVLFQHLDSHNSIMIMRAFERIYNHNGHPHIINLLSLHMSIITQIMQRLYVGHTHTI